MSKKKKAPWLILAAIPLVYQQLYRNILLNRKRAGLQQPLPAITEATEDFFLSEAGYSQAMDDTVLPYITKRKTKGSFHQGHRISYSIFQADEPRASVVISHGLGENIHRYAETIYYFLRMGYHVFIPEHYGHGESESGVEDNTLIWVDSFTTYTDDLSFFIKEIAKPKAPKLPLVIFGHSMGGAIATSLLEKEPAICDGAILSAPMMKILLLLPESLVYPLTGTLSKSPLQQIAFLGEKETMRLVESQLPLMRATTHSASRGSYAQELMSKIPYPPRWVISWGWAHEAMKTTHEIVLEENANKIKVPLLMFQAGTDFLVDPKGMFEFAAQLDDVEFYKVHGAFHEIYNETNQIIIPYFHKIQEFLERVSKTHQGQS